MEREVIQVPGMKAYRGVPLAPAIRAGGLIHCSGQLPVDLDTGELLEGDIRAQTRQVLLNLRRVLELAGSGLERTLMARIYMVNVAELAALNEVFGEFFPDPPARTTVEVSALARPGCLVEIDVVTLA